MAAKQAIVVDLGGTHLRCGVSEADGVLHSYTKIRITSIVHGASPTLIWDEVLGSITKYVTSLSCVRPESPIIISFPGPIEHPSKVVSAPTVAGATAPPDIRGTVAGVTGRPVHIINDISAAAWYLSETLLDNRFLVVTVSSGIGSKIFDRAHRLGVLDDTVYAGEFGHVIVDESADALLCDCGGRGHLGAIASGRGIERTAQRRALCGPAAFQASTCVQVYRATAETLNNESHIVPAARRLDSWTLDVIRDCTRPLAKSILTVVLAAGIQRVAIIGGFAVSLGPIYLRLLGESLAQSCDYSLLRSFLKNLLVLDSSDACLKGAGVYGRFQVKDE